MQAKLNQEFDGVAGHARRSETGRNREAHRVRFVSLSSGKFGPLSMQAAAQVKWVYLKSKIGSREDCAYWPKTMFVGVRLQPI